MPLPPRPTPPDKPVKREVITRQVTVTEEFDKQELINRRDGIQSLLTMPAPTDQELIDIGRANHPYFSINRDLLQAELSKITQLLGE